MNSNEKFLREAKKLEKNWRKYGISIGPVAMESARLSNELPWPPDNLLCPKCNTPLVDKQSEYHCIRCRFNGINEGRYQKGNPMSFTVQCFTVQCLICEKELVYDRDWVYEGGILRIEFGYGSRHDRSGAGWTIPEKRLDKILNSDEIQGYLCDDCFEKKLPLLSGFRVTKSTTRTNIEERESDETA